MSEVKNTDTSIISCASCGVAEVDDIKLKECSACDLVRYCSDACRDDHKSEHEESCKIRAAKLRDELLFKQPESTHQGDCPICFLPLPLHKSKSTFWLCCGKTTCNGCHAANQAASMDPSCPSCPFCRKPVSEIMEQSEELLMKRVKANDPAAILCQAFDEYEQGNYEAAFELYTKAAELGDAEAHFRLADLYRDGKGVGKDKGKEIYHLEEATIGGHNGARHNIGCYEFENSNIDRGVKHYMNAAAQGVDESLKVLMDLFKQGFVSKEDLTTALRAHQAAVDAMKSPEREAAEQIF